MNDEISHDFDQALILKMRTSKCFYFDISLLSKLRININVSFLYQCLCIALDFFKSCLTSWGIACMIRTRHVRPFCHSTFDFRITVDHPEPCC